MSNSTENEKQTPSEELAEFMETPKAQDNFLTAIDLHLNKAIETTEHLSPYFEATSQNQPDEATMYQVLGALTQRLAIIDQFIEGIEGNNKLIDTAGYPLDRATAITQLLSAYFSPGSNIQADNKTVYHALAAIDLELSMILKALEAYEKISEQA